MTSPRSLSLLILCGLAALMAITRFQPVEHFLDLPDASWAVFFLAGFYLPRWLRWALPLLLIEAVAIDWIATSSMGVSDYCLTPAYAFLLPAHALLWFGGAWLRTRYRADARALPALCASALISTALAFAISNASFYWLGGRIADGNWMEFAQQFWRYAPGYVLVPCTYIVLAAVLHATLARLLPARSASDEASN